MININLPSTFKRLNYIDYLVGILILSAILIFLLFFSRKQSVFYVDLISKPQEYAEKPLPPLYWIPNSLKVGDITYDGGGKKIAEITSLENVDAGEQRRYIRLKLKVYGMFDQRTHQYRLNDIVFQIGKNIDLTIANTSFAGMVTYVGQTQESPLISKQQFIITLLRQGLQPWQASSYDNKFSVTNSNGKEIFRINKIEITPAVRSIPTDNGELKKTFDPYYKDVYITAIVSSTCYNNSCFYNEIFPIRIGEEWNIYSTDNKIEGAQIMTINKNEESFEK